MLLPSRNEILLQRCPVLDEMDVKILRLLQKDCTRPVAEIGKEV